MRTVYLVQRLCTGRAGTMTVPVKAFDDEALAKKCCEDMQSELLALVESVLVFPHQGNGKGIAQATGLTMRDMVKSFGIENIGHAYVSLDVHSTNLELPPPVKLILA